MRTKIILASLLFAAGTISCDDDENPVVDPVYEFVAFAGEPSANLNEFDNATDPFPLTAKLLAFDPYSQDIDLDCLQFPETGPQHLISCYLSFRKGLSIF